MQIAEKEAIAKVRWERETLGIRRLMLQMDWGGMPYCVSFSCMNSANSGLESVWPERLIENSAGVGLSRSLARRR